MTTKSLFCRLGWHQWLPWLRGKYVGGWWLHVRRCELCGEEETRVEIE